MKLFKTLISVIVASMAFVSCQETDNTFDPYENWQARNADWWEAIVRDSVHAAIDQAKAQWGEQWQEHCHPVTPGPRRLPGSRRPEPSSDMP